jgi:hypothetical protein
VNQQFERQLVERQLLNANGSTQSKLPRTSPKSTKTATEHITTKSPLVHTENSAEVHMRKADYWKRASKRFLIGTRFKIPCEAVEAGARTLEEWGRVLQEEREIELESRALRAMTHAPRKQSSLNNPA